MQLIRDVQILIFERLFPNNQSASLFLFQLFDESLKHGVEKILDSFVNKFSEREFDFEVFMNVKIFTGRIYHYDFAQRLAKQTSNEDLRSKLKGFIEFSDICF
eukprot:NODE_36_length_36011_cov_1.012920.p30 type:complete len:103 gc:universal NODE_36_length_36011_cov_1.012920:34735-34427(-)